jgi:tRNA A-37 threonylcarbamoyl transferase component Bud32
MGLTEIWKGFGRHARAPVPRVDPLVTPSLVADLLQKRLPAVEVRAKPGRWIIRTSLRDTGGVLRHVVLKVYRHDKWWKRALSIVTRGHGQRSPARLERRNLEWAAAQGIPVPALLSTDDFSIPGLGSASVLTTEELAMIPLDTAVERAAATLAPSDFREWKRDAAREVARLTRLLHQSRRFHKDLYLSHFYLPESALADGMPIHGRLWMLDFLRLKHHGWNWRRWRVKDLAQLLYSSRLSGVGVRDRLRFMRAYLRCSKLDRRALRLIRSVQKKAARYRRQNRRAV